MAIIANFYGLLFYSYYFSAVDAVTDVVAMANTYWAFQNSIEMFSLKGGRVMPENRCCGGGCGGFGGDCCWIIILFIILFCCCGNGFGGNCGC